MDPKIYRNFITRGLVYLFYSFPFEAIIITLSAIGMNHCFLEFLSLRLTIKSQMRHFITCASKHYITNVSTSFGWLQPIQQFQVLLDNDVFEYNRECEQFLWITVTLFCMPLMCSSSYLLVHGQILSRCMYMSSNGQKTDASYNSVLIGSLYADVVGLWNCWVLLFPSNTDVKLRPIKLR